MGAVFYYIFILPFLYLLSVLPFWILFGISDFFYVLMYYLIGYRKKVVYENLKNSFPDKSHKELKKIERRFFRYLSDLFIEVITTLTISRKSAIKHCNFTSDTKKLFDKLYEEKKSFIIVMGHYGNWEWAGNSFAILQKHQMYVIYHPLSNKQFNSLMEKMRNRFGNKLYAMKDTMREMVKNRNELNVTAFIADQTPSPEGAYWTTFLHQDTPVFRGTEKIAQKFNYPIVYVGMRRIKRGYYEVHAEMLVENPKEMAEGAISELHTRRLEKDILAQPEIWLWSHRRWKHKRAKATEETT